MPQFRHRLAFFAVSVAFTFLDEDFWMNPLNYLAASVVAVGLFWDEVKATGRWVERWMGWDKPRE